MVRTICVTLLLNLCGLVYGFAQGTYPVWNDYDSTFHAGALDIKDPVIAKRLLLLDFGHYYTINLDTIKAQYYNPNDFFGTPWRRAGGEGFKVSYNDETCSKLAYTARAEESYAGTGRGIHTSEFAHVYGNVENGINPYLSYLTSDSIVGYVAIPTDTANIRMAYGQRFTNLVLERGDINVLWALAGMSDSSSLASHITIGISMWIDPLDIDLFSPGDTLAYIVMLKRYTDNQLTCKCKISEIFDTVFITKAMYEAGKEINPQEYLEVTKTYDSYAFRTDTLRRYYFYITDTLLNNGIPVQLLDTVKSIDFAGTYKWLSERDTIVGSDTFKRHFSYAGFFDSVVYNNYGIANDTLSRFLFRTQDTIFIILQASDGSDSTIINVIATEVPGFDSVSIADSLRARDTLIANDTFHTHFVFSRHDTIFYRPGVGISTFGGANQAVCDVECKNIYDTLDHGRFIDRIVEESDVYYEVWSTGKVPIKFLRGRTAKKAYDMAVAGKFDGFLKARFDSITSWPVFDSTLWRFGFFDEPKRYDFKSFGLMSARMARIIDSTNSNLQLWNNTYQDLQAMRLLTGDLDSTDVKIIQMFEPQPYGGQMIPVMYANADSMDTAGGALDFYTNIAYNSDYDAYTESRVTGKFLDFLNSSFYFTGSDGRARGIDVARFRFREKSLSHPVYQSVQVHGNIRKGQFGYHATEGGPFLGFIDTPHTPEDIIATAWMAMNSGAEGVCFSDFTFDGTMLGPINIENRLEQDSTGAYLIQDFLDRMTEYEALHRWDRATEPAWQLPKMWVGFRSRFNAVRTVMQGLHAVDSIVGWKNLLYNQEQMSVFDTRQTFDDIPMLDTLLTRQAKRYARDGSGDFVDSTVYDPREKTYVEVTHFTPSWQDSTARLASRYFLITSRRSWPIDTTCYGIACTGGYGLGAIDVRRPVIRLVNHTGYVADSVVVERVGTSWVDTAAYGTLIDLPWHTPGQGALYRVTPIISGISRLGVAYNNATHMETTVTDTSEGMMMAVVERDSAIWLHAFAGNGTPAGKYLISDPADTVRTSASAKRLANNTNPSLARDRTGSAWLVVWERCDSNRNGSVEAMHINGSPDTVLPGGGTRLQLSTVRSLDRLWKIMTPAVVGLNGGWLTAWGSPTNGIEIAAVRNVPVPVDTVDISLVGTAKATSMKYSSRWGKGPLTILLDSICKFPTLAYQHYLESDVLAGPDPYQAVALAWQQGADTVPYYTAVANVLGPYIMYKPIHVNLADTGRPVIDYNYRVEHVSQGLPGCRFYHPSIAIDSLNLGVAFESHAFSPIASYPYPSATPPESMITLRFRDSLQAGGTYSIANPWTSPAYNWVENDVKWQYPSLVEFPSIPRALLLSQPHGALVWFDTKHVDRQYSYRYGDRHYQQLVDGSWPSMIRTNLKQTDAINSTGIFYRDSSDYQQLRGWGQTGIYFPAKFITQQSYGINPYNQIFAVVPGEDTIFSTYSVSPEFTLNPWLPQTSGGCDFGTVGVGYRFDNIGIDGPTTMPASGKHPGFFGEGVTLVGGITEPEDGGKIARSSVFQTTDEPVTVNRRVTRSDETMDWLNSGIYDTVMNSQPDIKIMTELVLASNDSVLWRDDTLSVRAMSSNDTVNNVTFPTDEVYPEGSDVYVRLRPVVTLDIEYNIGAGISFTRGPVPSIVAPKRAVQREGWESQEGSTNSLAVGGLTLEAVPNPARDQAQLRLWSRDEGPVAVSIWSMKGEELQRLPVVEAEANGTYSVDIDVSNVRTGSYLVRAESAAGVVTVELRVMR